MKAHGQPQTTTVITYIHPQQRHLKGRDVCTTGCRN
jgi:hypothetical protein